MCNRVQCEMPLLYATKLSSRIILVAQDDLWMTIFCLFQQGVAYLCKD